MDVFDQNVKIHVDTSDLDTVIKKTEQLIARLKKTQEVAASQGITYEAARDSIAISSSAVEFIIRTNSGYTIDELLNIVETIQKSHPNAEIRVEVEM